MRKLVYRCHQKSIGVQVIINRYAVALAIMRGPVIAKLAVAVARYFKLTFKVVYPTAYKRSRMWRQIAFEYFYFIQLYLRW